MTKKVIKKDISKVPETKSKATKKEDVKTTTDQSISISFSASKLNDRQANKIQKTFDDISKEFSNNVKYYRVCTSSNASIEKGMNILKNSLKDIFE